jgi:hypothetical protein
LRRVRIRRLVKLMRVIVPHTYRPSTVLACCEAAGVEPELHDVSGSPLGYWRLMCEVWADQQDCILIEHDMSFPPETIAALIDCPEPWCLATHEFQLTRWRGEFMRKTAGAFASLPMPFRHWFVLSTAFQAQVVNERSHPHRAAAINPHDGPDHSRTAAWAEWLRQLPADVPEFRSPLVGDRGWREWAWQHASGHPRSGGPSDLACAHEYCKRGHGGRSRCPNCVDNPLPNGGLPERRVLVSRSDHSRARS